MSDPACTLFDGDHETPFLVAPPIVWQDETLRCIMTKLKFRVRAPFFGMRPRGSRDGRAQGFLVGQPPPRIVAGDLLEFEQLFATIPARPSEPVPYVYPYQIVFYGGTSGPELAELPVPLTATAGYTYYHTSRPESIPLNRAFKIAELQGTIVFLGGKPAFTDTFILAEDETISRVWPGGDIFEVRSLVVPTRALQTLGN